MTNQSSPGTEYTQALAKAGLRHAEEISARLAKPEWKPSRAQIEQARNSIKKLSELLLTPAQSGVMRSADKALETVASWSSSKQAYAARVTGAGVAQAQSAPDYFEVAGKLGAALVQIAAMDPKECRADDLGRAARIARDALAPSEPSTDQREGGK